MKPLDFLDVADKLKTSAEEAERRTAVSRAYYAVYHYIRAYLASNSIPDRLLERHEKLIQCLRNSGLNEVEVLGGIVNDLKGDRIDADYKLRLKKFNILTCSEFYDRCQQAIKDFDSYRGPNLVSGIRRYLESVGDI